jgi:hypothetical protein
VIKEENLRKFVAENEFYLVDKLSATKTAK